MRSLKVLVLFYVMVTLGGCASLHVPEVPNHAIPANAKVGLLVNVEDNPTHTHVGTTIFNNFTKKYPYSWNMKDAIFQIYKDEIESSTNLNVIDLHGFSIESVSQLDFVDVKNKQWSEIEANSNLRNEFIEENLYAVITVTETPTLARLECGAGGCSERYIDGYGLYSRGFLGINSFTATAGFEITAEVIEPLVDLGSQQSLRDLSHYQNKSKVITKFSPQDIKNVSDKELEPVKTHILQYIQSVAKATSEFLK